MRSTVRATVLGLALLASGTWAQAQCTKDTDCKGDRVCDAGQCQAPPASAVPAVSAAPSAAPATSPGAPSAAAPVVQQAPVAPLASAPVVEPELQRRSVPLMVTGIVMTVAGPVTWLAGLAAVSAAESRCLRDAGLGSSQLGSSAQLQQVSDCRDSAKVGSSVVLIAGAVLIGAGIPLIVHGSKKVPGLNATARIVPLLAPGEAGLQLRVEL